MKDDKLQKAYFEVYADGEGGRPETIPVLFNPSEYSISSGADYKSDPNHSGGKNRQKTKRENYVGTQPQTLSLELFFDTSGQMWVSDGPTVAVGDVSEATKKFIDMVRVKDDGFEPPIVCFRWGSLNFRRNVKDIKTTYVMFSAQGKPMRAKMNITIVEKLKSSEKAGPVSISTDQTKARTTTDDTNVMNVAQAEYGDPDMWRRVCQANNIADPLNIPAGTVLKVPPLD